MTQLKEEMVSSPWEVDVDVYLYPADHDPPFKIESYLQKDEDGDLVFYNRGRPGFLVSFHLHDQSGQEYSFPRPPDKKEALRSHGQEGCPPDGCGQWDEFFSERIEHNGKTLVVRNLNTYKTKFGYTLRVTNDDGKTYRELDPGGENQNGNFE